MNRVFLAGFWQSCGTLARCGALAGVVGVAVAIAGTAYLAGVQAGAARVPPIEDGSRGFLLELIDAERRELAEARSGVREEMSALALRVGRLQAHLLRIEALGERLTTIGGLDSGEFDFRSEPAVGGPDAADDGEQPPLASELEQELATLARKIEDREGQLRLLEGLLLHSNLQAEVYPAGRPIESGWLSSRFGMRNDPFTGRRTMHKGVDFAGKKGSNIVTVASGVVTWAGKRSGYGQMVEVSHGNGYVTRYGHNAELLVQLGDQVQQGQPIALMGSSGRSTGPHVHFEVLRNGKAVDPSRYIRISRAPEAPAG